jgi:glycosyltransferase involved in cell wall biosynthesis
MTAAHPTVSIVVPVYNEVESLAELLTSVEAATATLGRSHEVIFIDDGSTDGSFETLTALAAQHAHVRLFSFRRNLGKSPALTCGFQAARGAFVLTLDADLQDDPAALGPMWSELEAGRVDVVSGWRKSRRDSRLKIVSSKLFNAIVIRTLFGQSFRDMNSGMKLYRASVTKDLRLYGGMHRFIPLIVQDLGYRVAELPVAHHARKHGQSKYKATKILTELPDLLTLFFLMKYTRRPLHFFARIGSALFGVGFVVLLYLSVLWMQGIGIGTRPLLLFGVLLVLIGGQTVFTGLLADLIVSVNQNHRQEFPIKFSSDEQSVQSGRSA